MKQNKQRAMSDKTAGVRRNPPDDVFGLREFEQPPIKPKPEARSTAPAPHITTIVEQQERHRKEAASRPAVQPDFIDTPDDWNADAAAAEFDAAAQPEPVQPVERPERIHHERCVQANWHNVGQCHDVDGCWLDTRKLDRRKPKRPSEPAPHNAMAGEGWRGLMALLSRAESAEGVAATARNQRDYYAQLWRMAEAQIERFKLNAQKDADNITYLTGRTITLGDRDYQKRLRESAEAALATAEQKLVRYGKHDFGCRYAGGQCDCGLTARKQGKDVK